MGRFANKYISNINKNIETNRNQVGWEMRTKDNLGEFRYKNDQFELVYDDKSVLVLNAGGIVITETYVVESSSSYTINAGDNIILNSTNNINMTSVENINITSGDNITFTSDNGVLTWDGNRLTTDTETVAYLTDIDPNTTIQGNIFNGINQLVQLDSSTRLPAVDGSQLTNLPIGGITQNANLSIKVTNDGIITGDTRGDSSIDLQTYRDISNEVASGKYSSILGSAKNKANNNVATVIGVGGKTTTDGEIILSSSNSGVKKSIFILEPSGSSMSPVILKTLLMDPDSSISTYASSINMDSSTAFSGTIELIGYMTNDSGRIRRKKYYIDFYCNSSGVVSTPGTSTAIYLYPTIVDHEGTLTYTPGTNILNIYVTANQSIPVRWVCVLEGMVIPIV